MVTQHAFLDGGALQGAFEGEAGFFERSTGGEIVGIWLGEEALEAEGAKAPRGDGVNRLGGNAASPVINPEPVAAFAGESVHIRKTLKADAADAVLIDASGPSRRIRPINAVASAVV